MYTYEQLAKANEEIKTTPIKGKNYAEVPQRIKAFRSLCPHGAIITEMLSDENGICVFRATVYDEDKNIIGTGHAYENEMSSFINKTSYIENCETSAVGRALGMCGFGVDTSIASYEEVANAITNQEKQDKPAKQEKTKKQRTARELLILKLNEKGIDVNEYAEEKGLDSKTTPERFAELLAELGE